MPMLWVNGVRWSVAAAAVLCGVGLTNDRAYCQVMTGESAEAVLLQDEGVILSPQSRVSVHSATNTLQIRVIKGGAIFRPHGAARHPIVVTAGSVQLSNIEAAVCVNVNGNRTRIEVLDGGVDMSVVDADGASRDEHRIPLRPG